MATNVFFNNFDSYAEKNLIEDLVIESIKMYGIDVHYCPREIKHEDDIYREDTLSEFNKQYLIEMYVKNVEGFEGEGDFLSKFNIQIRDETTFTVARRIWNKEVGEYILQDRPLEGDLIYFPLTGKVYTVKFVEHEPVFYQLGGLQMYDLRCELFEYSNEKLNTGLSVIDDIETEHTLAMGNNVSYDANGNVIIDANTGRPVVNTNYFTDFDPLSDNKKVQDEANTFIDFSETDPFSDGNY